MRKYLVFLCLFVAGCVPAYAPNGPKVVDPVVTKTTSASAAFDQYKKDSAANFRRLAQSCLDGTFEYVSELVEASKAMDHESKIKRSKPIDQVVANELGDGKLDQKKGAEVMNRIADDLDPPQKGK